MSDADQHGNNEIWLNQRYRLHLHKLKQQQHHRIIDGATDFQSWSNRGWTVRLHHICEEAQGAEAFDHSSTGEPAREYRCKYFNIYRTNPNARTSKSCLLHMHDSSTRALPYKTVNNNSFCPAQETAKRERQNKDSNLSERQRGVRFFFW